MNPRQNNRPRNHHRDPASHGRLPRPHVNGLTSLSPRAQEMAQQLIDTTMECLTCMERIHYTTPIWICTHCYMCLHISCVRKWRRSECSSEADGMFRCPHCQHLHSTRVKSSCFCGKEETPKYNPLLIPHSCGETCGRRRPTCPHPCTSQCHPGPCNECTVTVGPTPCPCGATTYFHPCGHEDPAQGLCSNPCGKVLNCGAHRCERSCHVGPCGDCAITQRVACPCGKSYKEVPCGGAFCCDNTCGRLLPCGAHHCELRCHEGACPSCPTDPRVLKHCPCNKTTYTRTSCSDPIPACNGICRQLLACGLHRCPQPCHDGDCPPCGEVVDRKCRCGSMQKKVTCSAPPFTCQKVCFCVYSCGKGSHTCRTVCCPDRRNKNAEVHICRLRCDRKLPCGHMCTEACHRGGCPPCIQFVTRELYCRCGTTVSYPPQPCGTQPPTCDQLCRVEKPCGHPPTHNCHFDDCPPCTYPVTKPCSCHGHGVMNVPCNVSNVTCNEECGKTLDCGHVCRRVCHVGECIDSRFRCTAKCHNINEHCGHECGAACHGDQECPPCRFSIVMLCSCGRTRRSVHCNELLQLCAQEGELDEAEGTPTLPCTDKCNEHRFNIFEDRAKKAAPAPLPLWFSMTLWDQAARGLEFLRQVERAFASLLEKTDSFLSMPPASSEKRAIIHALAVYYNLKTESVDSGPNRSCIVTKSPSSHLPRVLLSEAIHQPHLYSPRPLIQKYLNRRLERTQVSVICIESQGYEEAVSEQQIARLLITIAGTFLFIACAENPDEDVDAVLMFPTVKLLYAGYAELRKVATPRFKFWIPNK